LSIRKALLVIADIGGYTRFMLATRVSLAHAQVMVSQLLEAVLDGSKHLELAKLEGDAAFFSGPINKAEFLSDEIAAMRTRFDQKKAQLVMDRRCTCAGCMHLEGLTLKFVAHAGEVAIQRVRQLEELAGVDVILVHRMLKNDVPIKEYVLVTDPVLASFDPGLRSLAKRLEHDFEGIGQTTTHYMESAAFEPPSALMRLISMKKSILRSFFKAVWLNLRSVLTILGLKKVPPEFFD